MFFFSRFSSVLSCEDLLISYYIYVSTSTTIRLSSVNVEVIRKQSITDGLGTEIRGCNWPHFENSKHVLQDGRGLCGTLFILSSHLTHIIPNMLIPIPYAKCHATVYEPIFGGSADLQEPSRKKPTWLLFEHEFYLLTSQYYKFSTYFVKFFIS